MHSTIFFTALAASGSLVSALSGSGFVDKRHGSLIDIDAVVGPILNDVELIDLDRRAIVPNCNADSGLQLKKRMDKLPRGLAGLEASVGIDIHLQVHTLLESTLSTLEPTFQTIEETVAKADDITIEELTHILRTAFAVIHKATGGLSGQLQRTSKTAKGGFSKRASIVDYSGVEERNLSDAEVAQVLSVLLNKVAGVVNLAEGLVEQLSILGPVLDPLFGQINGDLSLILSSVGNLLVGVVGLVRDLLSGALTTVAVLPILDNLLDGLLGGL